MNLPQCECFWTGDACYHVGASAGKRCREQAVGLFADPEEYRDHVTYLCTGCLTEWRASRDLEDVMAEYAASWIGWTR